MAGIRGVGIIRAASLAGLLVACNPFAAVAGGYDTGERDWDFLFQQDAVSVESGVRYIHPDRTLKNITGSFGPSIDVSEASPFTIYRASATLKFGDKLRCMGSYREPWGGHAEYGQNWTYTGSATAQHFSSEDYGLTCAVSMALEKGMLSLVGGYSWQTIRYELDQFFAVGPGFTATTRVEDSSSAWRLGLAYEIPEYALRASLIWNSAVDYDMRGTVINPVAPFAGPVAGSITMPQSVEAKFQSGVAPGWLAFGAVKWTDWSVADNMPLCSTALPFACTQPFAVSGLTLLFKDSWTVTLGAAHQFSEQFSLAGSLTWDQGATQGFTSQTDTWIAGLTAVLTPAKGVEFKLGGTAGIMTSGSLSTMTLPGGIPNPVGYTASFGNDLVYSLNGSAVFRF
ncbi:MAG: outer membrane protein transport protein [Nitratireductor sp.]|nr:outer membrane protein transport protein [Nitratireductor sp.]